MRSKVKISQICDGISTTLQFACFFIKHRLVACQIDQLEETKQISRSHFIAEVDGGRLKFDYQLRPGVSDQRLGVRVLEEEGVFDLLDGTKEKNPSQSKATKINSNKKGSE